MEYKGFNFLSFTIGQNYEVGYTGSLVAHDIIRAQVTLPIGKTIKKVWRVHTRVEEKDRFYIVWIHEQIGEYTVREIDSVRFERQPFYYIFAVREKSPNNLIVKGYRLGTQTKTGKMIANGIIHEGMEATFFPNPKTVVIEP